MELLEKVKATIIEHRLISKGDTVIAAVSGGADSTALLHLLASLREEWNLTLVVAHLDHRLRVDSADDARFVVRMADQHGLPSVTGAADVPGLARRRKLSIEEAGREARYEFLARVAREHGARRIATAHTQDDQIETVLMRILRGDPWDALGGIPIARPLEAAHVIRPLMTGTREEARRFLSVRSIEWREDPSNRDLRFDRNWIRFRVLPDLERVAPGGRGVLLSLSSVIRSADRLLNDLTYQHAATVAEASELVIRIPLGEFRRLSQDVQRRMLRWAASQITGTSAGLPVVWEKRAHRVATKGRPGDIVDGTIAVRVNYDALEVTRSQSQEPSREYRLRIPGTVTAEEFGMTLSASIVETAAPGSSSSAQPDEVYLDAGSLGEELRIRSWRAGDRMMPLGMRGKKKVQDLFVDDKVPRWERHRIPVVTDARGRIVWIVGRRISEGARLTERTRHIVRLSVRKAAAGPILPARNTPDDVVVGSA